MLFVIWNIQSNMVDLHSAQEKAFGLDGVLLSPGDPACHASKTNSITRPRESGVMHLGYWRFIFNFRNKITKSPRIELNCSILYCLCQLSQWRFEVIYLKSTHNLTNTGQLLIATIIIRKEEIKATYLWPLPVVKPSQKWAENSSPLRQVLIIKAFLMTLIHSRWKHFSN